MKLRNTPGILITQFARRRAGKGSSMILQSSWVACMFKSFCFKELYLSLTLLYSHSDLEHVNIGSSCQCLVQREVGDVGLEAHPHLLRLLYLNQSQKLTEHSSIRTKVSSVVNTFIESHQLIKLY